MLSHLDLINRDRCRLAKTIADIVKPGQKYALIDFPDYGNVGDSLIWLGSLRLLTERMGREPSYNCSWDYSKEQLIAAIGDGPIFLQGGGNFGDIYPESQALKNRIIKDNPERQIVQMPQSIEFRDRRNAAETRAVLKKHPHYSILVRDRRSAEFCNDVFDIPAILSPDAAFGLGPIARPLDGSGRTVALMREDDEMISRDLSSLVLLKASPVDWIKDEDGFDSRATAAGRTRALLTGQLHRQARRLVAFKLRANRRLQRGARVLSRGDIVVTDRLHAHILSVLLGIPNVCLDNDYGKIHSYIDAFTCDWHEVRKVSSIEEAIDFVQSRRN